MRRNGEIYTAVAPFADKSDCSVRALMAATGCTYKHASALFAAGGRSMRKGTDVFTSRKVHEDFLGMVPVLFEGTLASFTTAYPRGAFILHKAGHALAVVDGTVNDWESTSKPTTRIYRGWRVTEKTLEAVAKTAQMFT